MGPREYFETGLQFQTPPSVCVGIDRMRDSAHRSGLVGIDMLS